MSADDMLAAQLWPWPDPIIKRNAQGGIIFVNAAFLQLYGGQVTDWHGCAVDGWPAPVLGPQPSRFESRMPSSAGEQVFDWLEYGMADGGALAISRNVTALITQMPPPDSAQIAAAPIQGHDVAGTPPVNEHHSAVSYDAPPAEMSAPPLNDAPQYEAPQIETPHEPVAPLDTETHVAVEREHAEASAPAHYEPVPPAPQMETAAEPEPKAERDFERRALPIEDDESILGTNWRDAVIAKAVGADEKPAAPQNTSHQDTKMEDVSAIAAPESNLTAKPQASPDLPRILLAEDNAINALLTRTLLEADGCYVDVVEDGSLAVDAVKSSQYDMILMDMRMPNMDGLEATRKIRGLSNEAKGVPIIALTANAFDDDRNACFDAGMNDFMTKPVSAEELQQMVQTWTKSASAAAA